MANPMFNPNYAGAYKEPVPPMPPKPQYGLGFPPQYYEYYGGPMPPEPINKPFPRNHGGPGRKAPGFESEVCKDSYIGAPVKAWAPVCAFCDKKPGHCKCKGGPRYQFPNGVCAVVVDDINEKVYLYGNIIHENYHVPGNNCVPYVAVGSAGFEKTGRMSADEFFEGEQDNNNIALSHAPITDNSNTLLVFLNGLKQREGAEHDYVVDGNIVHFNFYELIPTDVVEVMYTYGDA